MKYWVLMLCLFTSVFAKSSEAGLINPQTNERLKLFTDLIEKADYDTFTTTIDRQSSQLSEQDLVALKQFTKDTKKNLKDKYSHQYPEPYRYVDRIFASIGLTWAAYQAVDLCFLSHQINFPLLAAWSTLGALYLNKVYPRAKFLSKTLPALNMIESKLENQGSKKAE